MRHHDRIHHSKLPLRTASITCNICHYIHVEKKKKNMEKNGKKQSTELWKSPIKFSFALKSVCS